METKWQFITDLCFYFKLDETHEFATAIAYLFGQDKIEYWNEQTRTETLNRLRVFTLDTICDTIYALAVRPDGWCGSKGVCPNDCPIKQVSSRCLTGDSLVDRFLVALQKETFFEDGEY